MSLILIFLIGMAVFLLYKLFVPVLLMLLAAGSLWFWLALLIIGNVIALIVLFSNH